MRIKNIMGFKKSSRSVAALAGIIVVAVMLTCVLNACTPAEEKTDETTTGSSTTTDSETTVTEETEQESSQSGDVEIDGISDYMTLISDIPEYVDMYDGVIEDTSVIEDDDIRSLAETYAADGYTLIDEGGQHARWSTLGDDEYAFNRGFLAMLNGDDRETDIWVYKMNEDLFDYYVVGYSGLDSDPQVETEDDGTTVRYSYAGTDMSVVAEFDRENGIGSLSYEMIYGYSDEIILDIDIDEIENPDLQAMARSYSDNGYYLSGFRVSELYSSALSDVDYPYGLGYRAFWQDQANCTEYYVFFFEGNEEIFDALYSDGTYGEVADTEVYGTITRVTTEYFDWGALQTYIFEYDSSNGIIVIRNATVYNPNSIGGLTGHSTEPQFEDRLDELREEYGDEISSEDDGTTLQVTFLTNNGTVDIYVVAEYNREYEWFTIVEEVRDL